jgi:transcriptional regulator of acetoin/glycerol metabolism
VLRRLYSTFAGGWPGIGLLVMRLVVGWALLVSTGLMLWSDPPFHMTLTSASLAILGLLLVAGLWSAHQAKPGQIELASGGVLFLDEVTEMILSAQAKFLRVLQEREFQRLGGTRLVKANIRVIAATNRDLRKAVERGSFREDLFYRLGVFDIQIPPLRDRASDIVPLSDSFLQEIGRSFGRPAAALTREARAALLQYEWPGNVRELRNVLEHRREPFAPAIRREVTPR